LYVIYAGRLFGAKMPVPEHVSREDTPMVADYLRDVLRRGHGCVVFASTSTAAHVCQVAHTSGYDFSGITFRVGGEPLTPAKYSEIQSVGAGVINSYAMTEIGIAGFGCAAARSACDDVHLMTSSVAAIQRRRDTRFGGGELDVLLLTTLFDKSSKFLLNVETGDYGVLETRHCGCELGALGLNEHLHTIRSFEKLTGDAMTFVGTDLIRIIEELLPARFGGVSTDYQMVEREEVGGRTQLDILVSPGVGDVDDAAVVDLILSELKRGSETNRMMAEVWRQSGMLRVRREHPHVSSGGKLLSLHILKESSPPTDSESSTA
jgi:hypothetical protein